MKTKTLLTVILMSCSAIAVSQIIHVPADQPTIQAGIDAATDGDTVLVAEATYLENINFMGKAITVASNFLLDGDTNHINNTIINGSQPGNPDYSSVVTFTTGEDTTSVLCGFTITGGTGMVEPTYGARIGGGIVCYYSTAKINYNKIVENEVNSQYYAWGGGMYSIYAKIFVSGHIFNHNSSSGDYASGGGIEIFLGDFVEITNNTISNNFVSTTDNEWYGAGVLCQQPMGPTLISGNDFTSNSGPVEPVGAGGGLCLLNAGETSINIKANRFHNNEAYHGGGVFERSCYHTYFSNNIFSENSTERGGGIGMYHPAKKSGLASSGTRDSHPQIINNTFSSNIASSDGGAVRFAGTMSPPEIVNCIFWVNTSPTGKDIRNSSSSPVTISYCDIDTSYISGSWTGEENINADPQFVVGDSLYHLSGSSPCRDTGHVYLYTPLIDYDGDSRPDPVFNLVDMGSDEYYEIPAAPIAEEADEIGTDSFIAIWNKSLWAQGYYLDVAMDENFDIILPEYNNYDVGNDTIKLVENLEPGLLYYYRVRAYNGSGISPYSETIAVLSVNVDEMQVEDQNLKIHVFPNPCSNTARLRYLLYDIRYVICDIYSISGIRVERLVDEVQTPGAYDIDIDVSDMPAGLYAIRIQAGNKSTMVKTIVIH